MADITSNFPNADILSMLMDSQIAYTKQNADNAAILKSIDKSLHEIVNGKGISLANAKNMVGDSRSPENHFRDSKRGKALRNTKNFSDAFEQALIDEFIGKELKTSLRGVGDKLARDIGVSVEEVPSALGSALGKQLFGTLKNTKLGGSVFNRGQQKLSDVVDTTKRAYTKGWASYYNKHPDEYRSLQEAKDKMEKGRSEEPESLNPDESNSSASTKEKYKISAETVVIAANKVVNGGKGEVDKKVIKSRMKNKVPDVPMSDVKDKASGAIIDNAIGSADDIAMAAGGSAAASGIMSAIATITPQMFIATTALSLFSSALGPAKEGLSNFKEALIKSGDRFWKSREANIKNAEQRMLEDVNMLVKLPFDILEDAAEKLYAAWDNNLRMINATQGYNKDDLQSLIGSYADRLRSEGLSSVVSAADITDNLSKVLQSGLSGVVAEEFAYLATKLNSAVPTQDFFGYASTYASIAANEIQRGRSEADAIAYANSQLELFASNLLYASREVSGGFTTGLKDAEALFEKSVQIAQAGRTNDATAISGVMSAVSAIVGAVAPDLATSMTDAIYKAATGGNSSEIVALRSLAGINASNTEFLQKLANDPQSIFTDLFNNLGQMQKMADGAYMEVAEGLSSVFGVSMDAFARVDFNYLAQAIASMNTENGALLDNIELLASGATTTTKEQMRMQQINEYMIEEGLSYVLDNEAARHIQQHMWAEQIAREQMEATYGVELEGASLELLNSILKTADNILTFLNPLRLIGKIGDLFASKNEANAISADIAQVLELGKVGAGNQLALYQLSTRNADLGLTSSYVEMLGGISMYDLVSNPFNSSALLGRSIIPGNSMSLSRSYGFQPDYFSLNNSGSSTTSSIRSQYLWGMIGKSGAAQLFSQRGGNAISGISDLLASSGTSSTDLAMEKAVSNVQAMMETMESFARDGKSYTDWAGSAAKYGISDLSAALGEAGYSESDVKGQFDLYQTEMAAEEKAKRELREEKFWDNVEQYLTEGNELTINSNTLLESIFNKHAEFYDAWIDYFVNHKVYASSYDHRSVSEIQRREKKGSEDAVYALADALTQNDTILLDPTMQTNALLAQILKVVNALLNQNNTAASPASIPDTLSGMALGLFNL